MADLMGGELEEVRLARAEGFAAGVLAGRQQLAAEVSVALRQMGLDLVAAAHRGVGAELLAGNAAGPGAVPPGGGR